MTMHIVFKKDYDGYKDGQSCYVERSLARRFCNNDIAITYQQHLDDIYDAEQAKKEKAEKRKADLLKNAKKEKAEKADSKKAFKRSKAINKK